MTINAIGPVGEAENIFDHLVVIDDQSMHQPTGIGMWNLSYPAGVLLTSHEEDIAIRTYRPWLLQDMAGIMQTGTVDPDDDSMAGSSVLLWRKDPM
jgi:hypothetical protein